MKISVRNMVAVLAEERVVIVVLQSAAIIYGMF